MGRLSTAIGVSSTSTTAAKGTEYFLGCSVDTVLDSGHWWQFSKVLLAISKVQAT